MEVNTRFDVHTDVHAEEVPCSYPVDVTGGVVYVTQRAVWVTKIVHKIPATFGGYHTVMRIHCTLSKPTARQIRKWKKEVKKN